MTIFRDFQGPRPRRGIGIARPRRDTQKRVSRRVSRPRHVSRHPALIDYLFIHELTIRPPNTDNNGKIKQNKIETK